MSEFNPDLHSALSCERITDSTFRAEIRGGWEQGRGAFGGLVLGMLTFALEQTAADPDRTLRTLSGEILAPVASGPAELRVEVLRRGSGISSLAARLWQDGEVRAHANAIFGKRRVSDLDRLGLTAPGRRWRDAEPVAIEPPMGPTFARAFEYRPLGPAPYSGSSEATTEGWIRAQQPPSRLGMPELVALADGYWPALLPVVTELRPMATLAFSFEPFVDPGTLDPHEPLLHRARVLGSRDGYSTELRELWTERGELVALNPQVFAVIR
jgi:hypothetical protein